MNNINANSEMIRLSDLVKELSLENAHHVKQIYELKEQIESIKEHRINEIKAAFLAGANNFCNPMWKGDEYLVKYAEHYIDHIKGG
jgi:chromosome segregation ATPase